MSLPIAPKDVSAHPMKSSVTDPVDKEKMHADVDRKLRFYGVIQAFRLGRLPDNTQIDDILRYVIDHSPINMEKLRPQSRQLIDDIRKIIETARLIVQEKNGDEIFQSFIWHTRSSEVDINESRKDVDGPAGKAKVDAQQAAHHLRTILSLLLTNGETRKLLSDFSLIGRDLLARSIDHIRPTEEELEGVDKPGPENTFVPLGKKKADNLQKPSDHIDADTDATTDGASSAGKEKEKEKETKSIKDRITSRIPQQHREKVDDAKKFLADEYFPVERRERFYYRGKKVILECQKRADYKESIRWLLDTLSSYATHGKDTAAERGKVVKALWDDPNLQQGANELLTLLARFANNQSTDMIRGPMDRLFKNAREDEEFSAWWRRVDEWCRKVLLEPGYVFENKCSEDGVTLREDGRKFYDEKYKAHFDALFDAIGEWFKALTTDTLNVRFGEDWVRLTHDLLFDSGEDGKRNLVWKQELWEDVRKVMVPEIVDKVGYIPIPRAEYTDDNLDLVIENLTLSGRNMFPNIISVEAHNYIKFSPYDSIPDESRHEVVLTLDQMQADMRDVLFSFRKKTGVRMRDSGLADILLTGSGITVTVHLLSPPKGDTSSIFRVGRVKVKVGGVKFSVRESRHDAIYKFLRPLATGMVKRRIKKAVGDAVRVGLEWIDTGLMRVRDRMEDAKKEEENRVEVLKELFKRQTDEEKEKQERRHSRFKVVAERNSVLLPEQGHSQGWLSTQGEREAIAKEGEEWRSKAFTVVPQA